MNNMQLIENSCGSIKIEISTPYTSYCSIGKEPFEGHLTITYIPNDVLLEFISYESWVNNMTKQPTTIEELTHSVFLTLKDILSTRYLKVECSAFTNAHGPVVAILSS
jgi:NADPH-dependent 7-cyano-7-deazaguanine reductase QueF